MTGPSLPLLCVSNLLHSHRDELLSLLERVTRPVLSGPFLCCSIGNTLFNSNSYFWHQLRYSFLQETLQSSTSRKVGCYTCLKLLKHHTCSYYYKFLFNSLPCLLAWKLRDGRDHVLVLDLGMLEKRGDAWGTEDPERLTLIRDGGGVCMLGWGSRIE